MVLSKIPLYFIWIKQLLKSGFSVVIKLVQVTCKSFLPFEWKKFPFRFNVIYWIIIILWDSFCYSHVLYPPFHPSETRVNSLFLIIRSTKFDFFLFFFVSSDFKVRLALGWLFVNVLTSEWCVFSLLMKCQ